MSLLLLRRLCLIAASGGTGKQKACQHGKNYPFHQYLLPFYELSDLTEFNENLFVLFLP
ncbi:MAG: hypothetical protein HPY89_02595 [Pelotomaculum sp.]|nr:hypothetical protein [Pelotomaculum sp.]